MLSEQVENYLKGIYELQSQGGKVITSHLSDRLRVSSASVTEMLQRLAEHNMVDCTPYKGVALTPEGQRRRFASSEGTGSGSSSSWMS